MPTSTVDIVNKALNYLGVHPIAALDEDSEPAQRSNAVYTAVRDDVLRGYWWGFATKITTLALISGETFPGWPYVYAYPAACVRVRKVFEDTGSTNPEGVEFEEVMASSTLQRSIATVIFPAYVKYTARVDDPNNYDPAFVDAFALKLAATLAHDLTGDKTMGTTFQGLYLGAISEAKRLDSMERKINDTYVPTYLQARG